MAVEEGTLGFFSKILVLGARALAAFIGDGLMVSLLDLHPLAEHGDVTGMTYSIGLHIRLYTCTTH